MEEKQIKSDSQIMKTHQGIKKRLKVTKPKRKKPKLTHQSKGRGSRHLKTKQSTGRKRRIRKSKKLKVHKNLKRAVPKI